MVARWASAGEGDGVMPVSCNVVGRVQLLSSWRSSSVGRRSTHRDSCRRTPTVPPPLTLQPTMMPATRRLPRSPPRNRPSRASVIWSSSSLPASCTTSARSSIPSFTTSCPSSSGRRSPPRYCDVVAGGFGEGISPAVGWRWPVTDRQPRLYVTTASHHLAVPVGSRWSWVMPGHSRGELAMRSSSLWRQITGARCARYRQLITSSSLTCITQPHRPLRPTDSRPVKLRTYDWQQGFAEFLFPLNSLYTVDDDVCPSVFTSVRLSVAHVETTKSITGWRHHKSKMADGR